MHSASSHPGPDESAAGRSPPASPQAHPHPYPLVFEPVFMEKVWGGRALERVGKRLPPGKPIGESWELADLGSTSSGGAGGQAVRSKIAMGPLAGRTLHDALQLWGAELLGPSAGGSAATRRSSPAQAAASFPLLVKFLDARENLSVQVHPSPAYLAANPHSGAHLKTESWYILDAEPGAKVYIGLRPGVTRAAFEQHIRDGSVVDDLVALPAVPGECHTLPSGTVHALGAGVLVAEVQTPSDTTFRVFDWGRTGRALHIEESLACTTFADTPVAERTSPPEPPASLKQVNGRWQLCARLAHTAFYTIDELRPRAGDSVSVGYRCPCEESTRAAKHAGAGSSSSCFILMVLGGEATLESAAGQFEPLALRMGQTVLVPASVASSAMLRAGAGAAGPGESAPLKVLRVGLG